MYHEKKFGGEQRDSTLHRDGKALECVCSLLRGLDCVNSSPTNLNLGENQLEQYRPLATLLRSNGFTALLWQEN